jgi:hypothetical protein
MGLILGIGGFIIILDQTLDQLVSYWHRRRQKKKNADAESAYARLEWRSNATLQLMRMAHEQSGCGHWSNAAGLVPVTQPGEKLAILDVADESHPLLERTDSLSQVDEKKWKDDSKDIEKSLEDKEVPRVGIVRKETNLSTISSTITIIADTHDLEKTIEEEKEG